MKTLISALLILSASTAMAEAPCQNPIAPACQKACAVMGAKYVLLMHEKRLTPTVQVRDDDSASLDNAQRLAQFAGLSLPSIENLTIDQINRAIAARCPR